MGYRSERQLPGADGDDWLEYDNERSKSWTRKTGGEEIPNRRQRRYGR